MNVVKMAFTLMLWAFCVMLIWLISSADGVPGLAKIVLAAVLFICAVVVLKSFFAQVEQAFLQRRENREELRWHAYQHVVQREASQNGVYNVGHTVVRGEVIRD